MSHGPSRRREGWLLAALLAVTTALFLASLSLAQLTEREAAIRALGRTIAILSEVDSFLEDRHPSLLREAEASETGTVPVEGFPVAVDLTSGEVIKEDRAAIRGLILLRAAGRVYQDGAAAFREEGSSDTSLVSKERVLVESMDALRSDNHEVFKIAAYVSGGAAIVLAVTVLLRSPVDKGLVRLGAGVAIGALAALLGAVGLWFVSSLAAAGTDDYLTKEFFKLVEELSSVPIRNALVLLGAGVSVALLGLALSLSGGRTQSDSAGYSV